MKSYYEVSEKDTTDVNKYVGTETTVLFTSGRTNWFTINHNVVIKDVRQIHFHEDHHIEVVTWNKDDMSDRNEIRVYGVFHIVCDGVYWSKKVNI